MRKIETLFLKGGEPVIGTLAKVLGESSDGEFTRIDAIITVGSKPHRASGAYPTSDTIEEGDSVQVEKDENGDILISVIESE